VPVEAEGFAKPAFDAISPNRAGDGSRHGEPQSRARIRIGRVTLQTESREQRGGDAETFVINEAEIGGA
jgi:hypothetical protein